MLFGGNAKPDATPKKSGNADDLMDLLVGGGKDDALVVEDDAIIVEDDDAIIIEDDAIIVEQEAKAPEKAKKAASKKAKAQAVDPKLTNLTEEEIAILNAA